MLEIRNLPEFWSIKPLPNVVFFQEGPGVRKHQYRESGVKLLNVGNINEGNLELDKTARYISEEEAYDKYSHFLVEEGDLIIGSSGIVVDNFHNKIAFAEKSHLPLCMNTSTIRFKALDRNILDICFFKHFLATSLFKNQIRRLITGSAQLNFGPSHLKQMQIPLPPLPEQKRIAAILDKADAIRRKRRLAIEKSEDFLRSVFLDMFGDPATNPKGWPVGTIRDLVREVKYGTSGKAGDEGKYPILRMNNITYSGNWNFSVLKYIDLEEKEEQKYLAQKGDLLFNRTNSKELVGKTAVYREIKPMAIAGYLIRVRPNEKGDNEFISGYLNSNHGKTKLRHMCKTIVGMANINAQELQDIPIFIPPIDSQKRYARLVSVVKTNSKKLELGLRVSNQLFSSLTHLAFRGELTNQAADELLKEAVVG